MKLATRLVSALGIVCLLLGGSAQANLVVNGSFEDPSLNYGTWSVFGAISGWTALSGSGIEVQNHAAGTPYDGANLVELDSYDNSCERRRESVAKVPV